MFLWDRTTYCKYVNKLKYKTLITYWNNKYTHTRYFSVKVAMFYVQALGQVH